MHPPPGQIAGHGRRRKTIHGVLQFYRRLMLSESAADSELLGLCARNPNAHLRQHPDHPLRAIRYREMTKILSLFAATSQQPIPTFPPETIENKVYRSARFLTPKVSRGRPRLDAVFAYYQGTFDAKATC